MIRISCSVFAKQVSGRSPVSCYNITSNLFHYGYPCDRIPYPKVYMSQKSGKSTDGSDKGPPSQLTPKTERPDLNKKVDESTESDIVKKEFLFNLLKDDKDLSKNAVDLSKDNLPASQSIPEKPKKELRLSILKGSKSVEDGKVEPSSWIPKKKYGVDFSRESDDTIKPLISEKPYTVQYPKTHNSVELFKKTVNSSDLPNNRISTTKQSGESRPASWIPARNVLDSSGYFDKGSSENWTPSVRYCPCVTKPDSVGGQDQHTASTPSNWVPPKETQTGSYAQGFSTEVPAIKYSSDLGKVDKPGSDVKSTPINLIPMKNVIDSGGYFEKRPSDYWTPNAQYCPCAAKSGVTGGQDIQSQPVLSPPQQFSPASFQQPAESQGNWIPTPQYFAADFSERQGDHRGNYNNQLPSNWTTQYHADPSQPAGGSGGAQDPSKKPDSDGGPCDKKDAFNPSKPSIYNLRKYSPELPSNASILEFEGIGNMPTGVFRNHTGECLGPAAQKGGVYQNPEYFAFHNMTYYDLHYLLREFRRPSPDTKRKL